MINDYSEIIGPFRGTLLSIHPFLRALLRPLAASLLVLIVFSIASGSNETDIPKQGGPRRVVARRDAAAALRGREIGFRLRLPD